MLVIATINPDVGFADVTRNIEEVFVNRDQDDHSIKFSLNERFHVLMCKVNDDDRALRAAAWLGDFFFECEDGASAQLFVAVEFVATTLGQTTTAFKDALLGRMLSPEPEESTIEVDKGVGDIRLCKAVKARLSTLSGKTVFAILHSNNETAGCVNNSYSRALSETVRDFCQAGNPVPSVDTYRIAEIDCTLTGIGLDMEFPDPEIPTQKLLHFLCLAGLEPQAVYRRHRNEWKTFDRPNYSHCSDVERENVLEGFDPVGLV